MRLMGVAVAVAVALMLLPAVALADPFDLDPGWGQQGTVVLGDAYSINAVIVDEDGTAWALGNQSLPNDFSPFLVRISPDGDTVTEFDVELDGDAEIEVATRTPDGFAVAYSTFDDRYLAKLRPDGSLDDDFGIVELGPTGDHRVFAMLWQAGGLLVAGTDDLDPNDDLSPAGTVRRFMPDGTLDEGYGVFVDQRNCATAAVALFRTWFGVDVVTTSCGDLGVSEQRVFSLDAGAIANEVVFDVTFLDSDYFSVGMTPDGLRVMARTGLFHDLDTQAKLQMLTFRAAPRPPGWWVPTRGQLDDRIIDDAVLGSWPVVVVADRAGGAWVLAGVPGKALMFSATDPAASPIEVVDPSRPMVAATDWTNGAIFLGWNDGRITRTSPDGSGRFTDDDDSVHERDITVLASSGITSGCNPPIDTRFCPDVPLTRGQMAALLVRALDLPSGADTFIDDDHSEFEADIDALADADITAGCAPRRFCPERTVTRAEMAAFLTRALGLPPGPDAFADDDSSVFEADIDALAAAGITRGCAPDAFCPGSPVTRAQAASFLVRSGLNG